MNDKNVAKFVHKTLFKKRWLRRQEMVIYVIGADDRLGRARSK